MNQKIKQRQNQRRRQQRENEWLTGTQQKSKSSSKCILMAMVQSGLQKNLAQPKAVSITKSQSLDYAKCGATVRQNADIQGW